MFTNRSGVTQAVRISVSGYAVIRPVDLLRINVPRICSPFPGDFDRFARGIVHLPSVATPYDIFAYNQWWAEGRRFPNFGFPSIFPRLGSAQSNTS